MLKKYVAEYKTKILTKRAIFFYQDVHMRKKQKGLSLTNPFLGFVFIVFTRETKHIFIIVIDTTMWSVQAVINIKENCIKNGTDTSDFTSPRFLFKKLHVSLIKMIRYTTS